MNSWQKYEKVAQDILKQLRDFFDLVDVQDKQKLAGKSGTDWEVDVVATSCLTRRIVIVECRFTKARQSQTEIAALAFTVKDIGAERGVIVTPHLLQKGAKLVADSSNITHFKLDRESCSNNFLAEALGKIFLGLPSLGDMSQIGGHGIKQIAPINLLK